MQQEYRRKGTERSDQTVLVKSYGDESWAPCWSKPFPVNGQGIFIFNIQSRTPLWISVEDENGGNSLVLLIGNKRAVFLKYNDGQHVQLASADDGLEEGKVSYWYSYDRDNLVLKYGKGYRMEETTILKYDFLDGVSDKDQQDRIRQENYPYFNAEGKKFVRQYDDILGRTSESGIQITEDIIEFEKHPFICNIPPLVLDSFKTNLFILDQSEFIFSACLPPACKELYENIRNCSLNYPEEIEEVLLSDAIRYSIDTEGCLLHEKLKEKSGEFGVDPNMTYLRVTLGHSLGKSPGIPYVLEIWPKGHYSPIHNHGNANAVIKVLFGTIHINIYNKDTLDPLATTIKEFDAREGDVTWINRNWYQTHKLDNISDDYCATIQCYNYDEGDNTHWPYFDYIKENKTIGEFLPDSDFTFQNMRRQVLNEYKGHITANKKNY